MTAGKHSILLIIGVIILAIGVLVGIAWAVMFAKHNDAKHKADPKYAEQTKHVGIAAIVLLVVGVILAILGAIMHKKGAETAAARDKPRPTSLPGRNLNQFPVEK